MLTCQFYNALAIVDKKADYVLALKNNHPSLYDDVKLFFEENSKEVIWDEYEDTDAGHGMIEVRKVTVTKDLSWLQERYSEWTNIRSIILVDSLRINKKTLVESREKRYYISSLSLRAKDMLSYVRNHWSIENSVHWVLDMNFKEDSCRTRTEHGAENLSIIRKLAMNLIKNKGDTGSKKISTKRKLLRGNWNLHYLKPLIS